MKFNFQTIILIIFGIGAAIGIAVLATYTGGGPGGSDAPSGDVVIWGTAPRQSFERVTRSVLATYNDVNIRYVVKSNEDFDDDLTEALAAGEGPDLFFLTDDRLVMHSNKVFIIPYTNYPRDTIINSYVDQAQMLFHPEGVLGFPLMIDPMVMYMNRDIMSSSFIVNPPVYWDELITLAPQVVQKTQTGSLRQNLVAFGTPSNIEHFQDVFALIMMQSGNTLISRDSDQELESIFRNNNIADSVIRYMASFTNPGQPTYSWNISQPNDKEAFLRGDLALYFGYTSELSSMRNQNPNLNFSVHLMPQTRERTTRMTYGRMTALGINKSSRNFNAAFLVASELSKPEYGQLIQELLLLPPIHRSLLSQPPEDPTWRILYDSAIISRGWLNPRPRAVRGLFNQMMQDATSGRMRIFESVNRMDAQLEDLL